MNDQNANNIVGKVKKTADMAVYQDGAVVSREIIKKGVGTVTIFAFDKGQGLSEHTVPFDSLVNIIDGEPEIFISGNSNRLKAGDFIIMPANEPHSLNAVEKFKMMLTMIRA